MGGEPTVEIRRASMSRFPVSLPLKGKLGWPLIYVRRADFYIAVLHELPARGLKRVALEVSHEQHGRPWAHISSGGQSGRGEII